MKKLLCILALGLFLIPANRLLAQNGANRLRTIQDKALVTDESRRLSGIETLQFNPLLEPFYHGVASGDPLASQVIIWTRVTPDTVTGPITVDWEVATDTSISNVVQSGQLMTDNSKDYTVKVDVSGLTAGTTYYYRFTALGKNSIIGRTKTLPAASVDHLKFAVVSCSNYQHGFFNAYARIADRNDLDAIIHLGDYFYEYQVGGYGDSILMVTGERAHDPDTEAYRLQDYRGRYSQYRLDMDLMRAHQQHPFISVWDDHETANDAWKDGAENHQPATEGPWETRKTEANQAYFEWMPIRVASDSLIRRKFQYGDLADLIMLDTRLEGREEQPGSILDPDFYDQRTILGDAQRTWLFAELDNSTAKWRLLGNQVIFAQVATGWFVPGDSVAYEDLFLDIWDGYPAERDSVIDHLANNNIGNVVFLTGDFHSSFAFDIAPDPFDPLVYTPATGMGSLAVEFACSSITAANFDENLDPASALLAEQCLNQPCPFPFGTNYNPNPHLKYTDLDRHGYFILDVKPDSVQANFYFVGAILSPNSTQMFDKGAYTLDGENHLILSTTESGPKAVQDIPAPAIPMNTTAIGEPQLTALLLGVYPNPASNLLTIQYAVNHPEAMRMELLTLDGKEVLSVPLGIQANGMYKTDLNISDLSQGVYLLRFHTGNSISGTRKFVVIR